ncbi:hypothetical protein ACFYU5_10490 [Nocardia aobensis]|uniref:Uncharacterized protein n=1 Tax=Nocardia aobensis TaxID=257277 RepID=A0ABW6P0J0_9NOCA
MSDASPFVSAALLAVGAGVGFLPTYVIERSKRRYALLTRWDVPLFELCKQFTGTSRRLVHLAHRIDRVDDKSAQLRLIEEQHRELRGVFEQLRLVGSRPLLEAGRLIIHHSWSLRVLAESGKDPRAERWPEMAPDKRVAEATQKFLEAARKQLGVPDPDVVLEDPMPKEAAEIPSDTKGLSSNGGTPRDDGAAAPSGTSPVSVQQESAQS